MKTPIERVCKKSVRDGGAKPSPVAKCAGWRRNLVAISVAACEMLPAMSRRKGTERSWCLVRSSFACETISRMRTDERRESFPA